MDILMQILTDLRPDVDFTANDRLMDEGVLDSFDIVTLIGELNAEFDIEISVEDLIPENFNSAASMMELIKRLQEEV